MTRRNKFPEWSKEPQPRDDGHDVDMADESKSRKRTSKTPIGDLEISERDNAGTDVFSSLFFFSFFLLFFSFSQFFHLPLLLHFHCLSAASSSTAQTPEPSALMRCARSGDSEKYALAQNWVYSRCRLVSYSQRQVGH